MGKSPQWEVVEGHPPITFSMKADGHTKAWTARMYEMVALRGRVRREELIVAAMPLVPPGIALRRNEQARAAGQRRNTGDVRPRVKGTIDQQIESGQRQKANDGLWAMKNSGRILIEFDEDGTEWVVINPDWRPHWEREPEKMHARALRSAATRRHNREAAR